MASEEKVAFCIKSSVIYDLVLRKKISKYHINLPVPCKEVIFYLMNFKEKLNYNSSLTLLLSASFELGYLLKMFDLA